MTHRTKRAGRVAAFLIGGVALTWCALRPSSFVTGAEAPNPSKDLIDATNSKFKFEGSQTCAGAGCHSEATPAAAPKPLANEVTTWKRMDLHAKAFSKSLADKKSEVLKKVMEGMKITSPITDPQCIGCHSVNVPKELQGEKFSLREGVTCNACHGPSEQWRTPHGQAGWAEKQFEAAGRDNSKLLAATGLYYTKDLLARGNKCATCHLAIDEKMVAAGHPVPAFELTYYAQIEPPHWREPAEKYFDTRQWLVGQAVCVREAAHQLKSRADGGSNAESMKAANSQLAAHVEMMKAAIAANVAGLDGAAIGKAADAVKAAADGGFADAKAASAAADELAKAADAAAVAMNTAKPDEAMTGALIKAVAGIDAKPLGAFGIEQQALSVYSLYNSWAKATGKDTADKVAEIKALADPFTGEAKKKEIAPDDFEKLLTAAKGKLPG